MAAPPPGFLRQLLILHRVILGALLMMAAVCFAVRYYGLTEPVLQPYDQNLQMFLLLLSAVAYFAGTRLYRRKLEAARDGGLTAAEKGAVFRSASLQLWVLLEIPALLSLVGFLLVANLAYLFLALALTFFIFLQGPSKMKLMLLLRLSEQEIDSLG